MTGVRSTFALLLAAFLLFAPAWASKPAGEPADLSSLTSEQPSELPGERILAYSSDITVNADASLDVVETIRVRAEGQQINHGIYRDFPTRYERGGRTVRVGFDVQGVTRDGQAEPYATERIDNGVRVRIGDANVIVPLGEHTYVLRYRTTRQLGFFDNFDELYWNVTGNGWIFPIDRVEARIRLPQAAALSEPSIYTGAQGSTASNGVVASQTPGEISFRSTAPLGAYEGFTVAVRWPKGVVQAPPPPSATGQWLADNGPWGAAIASIAGLCWFFYYAWKRAGRGPIPGTVVPLFEPPEGMTAAEVRYVKRMGFDNRCFAAAIVESGVRHIIRLSETEGGWLSRDKLTIEKTGDPSAMPEAERNMLNAMFAGGTSLEMDRKNHVTFRAAQNALKEAFEARHKGRLFLANLGWAFAGLMLLFVAMLSVASVVLLVDPYGEPGLAGAALFGVGAMLIAIWLASTSRMVAKEGSWLKAIGAVLLGALGLLLLFGAMAAVTDAGGILPVLAPLLTVPLVLSAFWWMAAPTREGRQVMDRIAGFERYLSITEEDRLQTLHPPEKTPELFERFLPYAIALGVENAWANRFAGVLAAAAADPSRQQSGMTWYHGSNSPWTNLNGFTAAVGATLASSVASASTAPGSSSGSGGGGFSGGGGGGGGGGGW